MVVPPGRMKASILLCILAGDMSAQAFNGVTLRRVANRFTITNQSTKPILGYTLERNTRISPTQSVVDIGSLAIGKLLQPGEERTFYMFGGLRSVTSSGKSVSPSGNEEEEAFNYELMAVLFADGTFYGSDSILLEFSSMISIARSLALDMQYAAQDKYLLLEQDKQAGPRLILDALRKGPPVRPGTSQDLQKAELRMQMSNALLWIRDSKGYEEVEAALARIAALPDIVKGEQN